MSVIETIAPLIVFIICAAITAIGWIVISQGDSGFSLYLGCAAVFGGPVGLLLGEAIVLGRHR